MSERLERARAFFQARKTRTNLYEDAARFADEESAKDVADALKNERMKIADDLERCINEYGTPRAQVLSIQKNAIERLRGGS
jgi:hypothetical protein